MKGHSRLCFNQTFNQCGCIMGMSLPLAQLAFLDQLRGFVAVGRRMSMTLASEDLCLTQSAVSRQILTLEQQMGIKLLTRGYRSIAFTPEGERLFRSADSAIQQLQDAMGELHINSRMRPVTLSASIGVTGLWLLPRLNEFQKHHQGLDLRISANNRVGDLQGDGIDLAVRYTTAKLAPRGAIRLFGETIAPVAHPSLGIKPRATPVFPGRTPLLDFDSAHRPLLQWRDWLGSAQLAQAKPRGILQFNQYDQMIQAAAAGQGIALGRLELIQPMLDDGRLVAVCPARAQATDGHAYWLIQADGEARHDVLQVAQWLRDEAAKTQAWKLPPA